MIFLGYINRKKWHGCAILTKRSTSAFKGNFRIMIGNYDFWNNSREIGIEMRLYDSRNR